MKYIVLILILSLYPLMINAKYVFSFYGPAEISNQRDVHSEGMGGAGIGDLFRINTSLLNPALATTVNNTYFSTALSVGSVNFADKSNKSFRDDQIYLPYFNLIFPYKSHRMGINIHNVSSGQLETKNITEDWTDFRSVNFTLFKAGLFYAHNNRIINWGVAFNYNFGHNFKETERIYGDDDLYDTKFQDDHSFKNPSIDIGLVKNIGNISFGLSHSFPADLKGDKVFRSPTITETVPNEIYEYPAQSSFGLTWRVSESVYLSSDIDISFWGGTNNFENAVNTYRAGLGLSYEGDKHSRNFWERIPVRGGVSYRNMPFEINENSLNEKAYHLGISVPLKNEENYIKLAIKYFYRGDSDKHDYSENGILFTIGSSGFDIFNRRTDRKSPRDIPVPDRRF